MKTFRQIMFSVIVILLTALMLFSVNCSSGGVQNQPPGGDSENANHYAAYIYSPDSANSRTIRSGLIVLLKSIPPPGYSAVEGAKIYPDFNRDMVVYSNTSGRFIIDLDAITAAKESRDIDNDTIDVIIEPPAETEFLPIKHTAAPQNKNGDYDKIILHPNARNIKVGQVIQLQAMGVYQGNRTEFIDPLSVDWEVDDETIGTIDEQGVFTGLNAGTAMITITYKSLSCTGKVFVRGIGAESYTLSGLVKDQNNNPVADAIVEITGIDTVSITSSEGSYLITDVPGSTELTIKVLVNGQVRYSAEIYLTEDTEYNIQIQNTTLPTGSIAGIVTSNTDNLPVREVLVTLGNLSTTTDNTGFYRIRNIPVGTYTVNFDKSGFVSHTASGKIEADSTTTLNVILVKIIETTTGTIKGRVVDCAGRGITGAQVNFEKSLSPSSTEKRGINSGSATTDSQGNFLFLDVQPGNYKVFASSEGYISNQEDTTVTAGKEANAIIRLLLEVNPAISGGRYHSLALRYDSTVWAWGRNDSAQLGNGTITNQGTPVQVAGKNGDGYLTGVIAIAAGDRHSLALKADGTVWTWGTCSNGRLGNGTTTGKSLYPTQVLKGDSESPDNYLQGVIAIAAGGDHSLALKSDGTVWAWGWNVFGALGDGNGGTTDARSTTPVQVLRGSSLGSDDYLQNIVSIAAGRYHSVALRNDGTVWTWGSNLNGQLGNGDLGWISEPDNLPKHSTTPVQVLKGNSHSTDDYLQNVASISSGFHHILAIKEDGALWVWGNNGCGQLGDNTITHRPTPIQPFKGASASDDSYFKNPIAVSAGHFHTMAIKADNTVWTWGRNLEGQLGINTTTKSYLPVQVLGPNGTGFLTDVYAVSGGQNYHSMALKTDNTIWVWGNNEFGQVGNDSPGTNRLTPIQIPVE
jgi:alpha-tubulin suppressor-like RCC1 family protein